MFKKIIIGAVVSLTLVVVAGKAYIDYMDRQMDATPLVERLAATPTPDGFMLVSEWHDHGSWLIKQREPEASRVYLAVGPVDEVCGRIDGFYREGGVETRVIQRSDAPDNWCGRRLKTQVGDVAVWVERADDWRELPPRFSGEESVAQIQYSAHR